MRRVFVYGSGCAARQLEAEDAARAGAARDGDDAVVEREDVLHDREAEARASLLPRARLVHAVEPLEDALEVGLGDAVSRVAHLAPHESLSLAVGHGHPSALGVL